MNEPGASPFQRGQDRLCPHCGARVAQKAKTCFSCGVALDSAPARQPIQIPWADIALFAVIASMVVVWWVRPLSTPISPRIAASGSQITPTVTLSPTEPPTPTATPTPTPTPTVTPVPTPIRHQVVAGDTLELIAGQYGSTIEEIIAANGLSASGFIRAGQELLVPVKGPVSGAGAQATPASGALVVTVQQGDTLESIAVRWNSQIEWIREANKLGESDLLRIGQSLTVPLHEDVLRSTATPAPVVMVTPTPRVGFDAPATLTPGQGATISGREDVVLSWASVGVLGSEQWYVVTVRIPGAATQPDSHWTKGTTWRLSPDYRLAGQEVTLFVWSVQVVGGTPAKPGQPISPPSPPRSFTWR